jgi:hypothetical protein
VKTDYLKKSENFRNFDARLIYKPEITFIYSYFQDRETLLNALTEAVEFLKKITIPIEKIEKKDKKKNTSPSPSNIGTGKNSGLSKKDSVESKLIIQKKNIENQIKNFDTLYSNPSEAVLKCFDFFNFHLENHRYHVQDSAAGFFVKTAELCYKKGVTQKFNSIYHAFHKYCTDKKYITPEDSIKIQAYFNELNNK